METPLSQSSRKIVEQLYAESYADLCLYIMRYTRDRMAAEDMAQDVFVRLLGVDLIAEATARQLLFSIAKRLIIDDARHRSFVRQASAHYANQAVWADYDTPAEQLHTKELAAWEQHFLSEMAPKRAKVYRMYRMDELSASEIAEREGLSKRTVEAHVYYATREMRSRMREIV